MSRFGEKALKAEGLGPAVCAARRRHERVYQYASNREQLREALKVPKDAFVVGMVANNQGYNPPRKAFPQAIQAFSAFRQDHPDALLYFHTEMTGKRGQGPNEGVDIIGLCERFEVPPSAVAFTPQLEMELGIPPSWMMCLYNCFDVLLSPSYGEGFGVPIIEAQACGTPVIVRTGRRCLSWRAGWIVNGEPMWHPAPYGGGDSFWLSPFVGDIIQALELAYEARGDEELRNEARAFALRYDADRVTEEFWKPALGGVVGAA
jgi:glycosyltransferase involved in cell wall biosynthesis